MKAGADTVPESQIVDVTDSDSTPMNATFSNVSPKIWKSFVAFRTESRTSPSSSVPPSRNRNEPSG